MAGWLPDWATGYTAVAITALGGIIVVVGTVLSAIGQNKKEQENAALQKRLADFLSGGGSVCYLHFGDGPLGPLAMYKVIGDNPVREVLLSIVFLGRRSRLAAEFPDMSPKELEAKSTQKFNAGTVWPGSGIFLEAFDFPDDGNDIALISISQLMERGYVELVAMRRPKEHGPILFAYRVFRVVSMDTTQGKVAELRTKVHHVDDGFPLDENGKVPWLDYPDKWGLPIALVDAEYTAKHK